jgi:hypothetical protein
MYMAVTDSRAKRLYRVQAFHKVPEEIAGSTNMCSLKLSPYSSKANHQPGHVRSGGSAIYRGTPQSYRVVHVQRKSRDVCNGCQMSERAELESRNFPASWLRLLYTGTVTPRIEMLIASWTRPWAGPFEPTVFMDHLAGVARHDDSIANHRWLLRRWNFFDHRCDRIISGISRIRVNGAVRLCEDGALAPS